MNTSKGMMPGFPQLTIDEKNLSPSLVGQAMGVQQPLWLLRCGSGAVVVRA